MIDILETLRAELDEAVELMRPHFPNDSKNALLARAEYWRPNRYQKGRWRDFAEVAKEEAEEAEQRQRAAETYEQQWIEAERLYKQAEARVVG